MRIFKGKASTDSRSLNLSILCPTCREAFKACFKKDKKGKIELDFTHNPELCDSCRKKMEQQFHLSLHPDRR